MLYTLGAEAGTGVSARPHPLPHSLFGKAEGLQAGGETVVARLAGWQQSPGERGDEGRQRETSACSIRKAPGGDSTNHFQPATARLTAGSHRQTAWNLHGWVGGANAPQMYTHVHTHMRVNM